MDKQFVREYIWRQEREEQRLEELNMAWGHQLPSRLLTGPFEGLTVPGDILPMAPLLVHKLLDWLEPDDIAYAVP